MPAPYRNYGSNAHRRSAPCVAPRHVVTFVYCADDPMHSPFDFARAQATARIAGYELGEPVATPPPPEIEADYAPRTITQHLLIPTWRRQE